MANNSQFTSDLKKFMRVAVDVSENDIKDGAFGVALKGTVTKTPFDDGIAKGNWNVAINTIDYSNDESRTSGEEAINNGKGVIATFKVGQEINITNTLPYINRLEFGYSDQAKDGMMRLTFQELINFFKTRNRRV